MTETNVWRDLSAMPGNNETVIVTDGSAWIAVAHRRDNRWWIGRADDDCREQLDFTPAFWLPREQADNPGHATFPDGRRPLYHPTPETPHG